MNATPRRLRFTRHMRMSGGRAFAAVFAAGVRRRQGPLTLCALPNGQSCSRLGLSVSRRVGGAVVRNRIKRLLREAFRLEHQDWPGTYDVVVVVHRHPVEPLASYRRMLGTGLGWIHRRVAGAGTSPRPRDPGGGPRGA